VGGDERERHRSPDQQGVHPVDEGFDRGELVRDLGPAEDRHVRAGWFIAELRQRLNLLL
jgi:hypothetical protein